MNKSLKYTWRILLLPFSLVYGFAVWIRNMMFDLGILPSEEFKLPIISVGNISAGGTGKTPHVEYLAELLKDPFKVAILSHGYRRKTRHFIVATENSSFEEIGDEPRQLKQKYPDITVAVDRKRVHGVKMLMKQDPLIDIILLDDAFQHRYIKPGFSILLIDYNQPLKKDFLLPAGRLREPGRNRNRADMILVTKSPERINPFERRQYVKNIKLHLRQHLYFTCMAYDNIYPVYHIENPHSFKYFKEKKVPVLIVTGIADPRSVKRFVRKISTNFKVLTYPDHHTYRGKDLEKIEEEYLALGSEDAIIITTEKDAMRFEALEPSGKLKQVMYKIRIKVEFLNNDAGNFNKQIISYVTSNKRDSILHKK